MIRIVILLLALTSGGIAAWMASSTSEEPAETTVSKAEQAPLQEVLVATSALARGTAIEESHIRWQRWEGEVPPIFISRTARPDALQTFEGWHAQADFVAGEPIREDKLSQRGAGFLSSMLPDGKRAIAVRVTAESTAGGFILPDDRVDVIHTASRSGTSGAGSEVTSRTILTNVRVLAIDQVASNKTDGSAVIGKTATLEVKPEQMAVIAAAEASGTVSLALRAITDNEGPVMVVKEQNQKDVVRIVSGGRSTLVEVPLSRGKGS